MTPTKANQEHCKKYLYLPIKPQLQLMPPLNKRSTSLSKLYYLCFLMLINLHTKINLFRPKLL